MWLRSINACAMKTSVIRSSVQNPLDPSVYVRKSVSESVSYSVNEQPHQSIITACDRRSKNNAWRFIRAHLWYMAGSSLHLVTRVSVLESAAARPYAGTSNSVETACHLDSLSNRFPANPHTGADN